MKCLNCLTHYDIGTCPVCGVGSKIPEIYKNKTVPLNDYIESNEVKVKVSKKRFRTLNLLYNFTVLIIKILGVFVTLMIPLLIYFIILKNIEILWLLLITVLAPFILFLWLLFFSRSYIIDDIFDTILNSLLNMWKLK